MELKDLLEARRNPTLNSRDTLDLQRYFEGRYYVSFSELPKIGINPTVSWTTPHGVYAYPLFHPTVQTYANHGNFPFASNRKYANILTASGKELLLSQITQKDVDSLIERLVDEFDVAQDIERLLKLDHWDEGVANNYWGLTEMFAIMRQWGTEKFKGLAAPVMRSQYSRLEGRASLMWNKVLRELGYDLVTDDIGKVLYRFEPIQTVFLNPRGLKLVERATSPFKSERRMINTGGQAAYFVERYKRSAAHEFVNAIKGGSFTVERYKEVRIRANASVGKALGELTLKQQEEFREVIEAVTIAYPRAMTNQQAGECFHAFVTTAISPGQRQWLADGQEGDEVRKAALFGLSLDQS